MGIQVKRSSPRAGSLDKDYIGICCCYVFFIHKYMYLSYLLILYLITNSVQGCVFELEAKQLIISPECVSEWESV